MMNKIFTKLTAVLLFAAGAISTVSAQQAYQKLGKNPFTIDPSAVLEIESTDKGFLPPRVKDTKDVPSPATGLIVYSNTTNLLMVNVGGSNTTGDPAKGDSPLWKAARVTEPTKFRYVKENDSVLLNDYTVFVDATNGPITLTLPAAADATGKIYIVGKSDYSKHTVTFTPQLKLTKSVSVGPQDFPKTYRVQSNGINWNVIN